MQEHSIFTVGDKLLNAIQSETARNGVKFQRRDFIESLIKYCTDGDYRARIGVVYGLRSTGKTVRLLQTAEALLGHLEKLKL